MGEHHREVAARLRALTYATSGILHFATVLDAGRPSQASVRTAAHDLTDRDRAQIVAFLLELRHEQQDAADAEAASVLHALIEALAQQVWDNLPPLSPDTEETI